jgi:hypothetical protein
MKKYITVFYDLSEKITKGDMAMNFHYSSKLQMLDVFIMKNNETVFSKYLFGDFEDHEEQFLKIKSELEGFIQA